MVRTQVQLREEQIEALKAQAAERNLSVSALVRQAVDRLLAEVSEPTDEDRRRRATELVGRFSSGRNDISAKHDEYLAEAYSS